MTRQRFPLAAAREEAARFILAIRPYVERVEIAGSIRRGVDPVSDIEIICIPKTRSLQAGLFGDAGGPEVDELHNHIQYMLSLRTALWPRADDNGQTRLGERTKYLVWNGIPLDLFSVKPPAQFGAILAIRTGPAKFSQLCVTSRADHGAMPLGIRQKDGTLWRGDPERGGQVIPTPEERDWFAALNLPCWEPAERTPARLKTYLKDRR